MSETVSQAVKASITRAGLNALFNLPNGVKQAITHIGLGTAKYTPSQEQTSAKGEIIKVPVKDSVQIDAKHVRFYAVQNTWMGNLTAIYEIIFYLADGTPLAFYSSEVVELALVAGSPNDLYYTLALEQIPADKIEIINTQVVFDPETVADIIALSAKTIKNMTQIEKDHLSSLERDKALTDRTDRLELRASTTDRTLNTHTEQLKSQQIVNKIQTFASWSMFEYIAELNRMQSQSGIVRARKYEYTGAESYHQPTSTGYTPYNGHDHSNIKKLVGTGEFSLMANGIYCHARHNDDGLYGHALVGVDYNQRQEINPPALTHDFSGKTPAEQIELAKQYLKVWAGQLPVNAVQYAAESAQWVLTGVEVYPEVYHNGEDLRDPFPGHRHQINVSNLQELFDQEKFYNDGGHKNIRENSVGIALAICDVDENNEPIAVLWRYRFISAEVGNLVDYPIKDTIEYYEDITNSQRFNKTTSQMLLGRECRFRVKQRKGLPDVSGHYSQPALIDELIGKIPGLDGHNNTLTETYHYYGANDQLLEFGKTTPLKAGYYNRWYTMSGADASNRLNAARGFADDKLWVARTTQSQIKQNTFGAESYGFSYFIPLEMHLVTFLNGNFNPYVVPNLTSQYTSDEFLAMYNAGKGKTQANPLPGHNDFYFYYKNPADIFSSNIPRDPADTTVAGGVWMTCADGVSRKFFPSGYGYFYPTDAITGTPLRTRYPIFYASYEGTEAHKEVDATRKEMQSIMAALIKNMINTSKLMEKMGL